MELPGFTSRGHCSFRFFGVETFFEPTANSLARVFGAIRSKIERGETSYLAGVSSVGFHNSGIALIELTRERGPRLIFNNEEERFSGEKHTNAYPRHSIEHMLTAMAAMGLNVGHIDAWLTSWDYAAVWATLIRVTSRKHRLSFSMLRDQATPAFSLRALDRGIRASRHITEQLGLNEPVALIATPHHDNHAWFSFAASPFAHDKGPALVAVLDGFGDMGAVSVYVCEAGRMRRLYCNNSIFDSLGVFYSVISSTQGGWTWLSSEGRYMGATAYGNNDRKTNPYYAALKPIFNLAPDGQIFLNRDLANWQRDILNRPYSDALKRILGEPIAQKDMWNPDAVLRVEDIKHKENTQERLDKAAATQMVFEDALMHLVAHFISATGIHRLVLTGGIGAQRTGQYANPRDVSTKPFFVREPRGVTAAFIYGCRQCRTMPASQSAQPIWAPITQAMEWARRSSMPSTAVASPTEHDIRAALIASPDIEWIELKSAASPDARGAVRRLHGLHDRAGRHFRTFPRRGRNRPARAWPSFDPRQPLQSDDAGKSQRAREIPRSHPSAGADDDA